MQNPVSVDVAVPCVLLRSLDLSFIGVHTFSEIIFVGFQWSLGCADHLSPVRHFFFKIALEFLLVHAGKIAKSMNKTSSGGLLQFLKHVEKSRSRLLGIFISGHILTKSSLKQNIIKRIIRLSRVIDRGLQGFLSLHL